MVVMWGQSRRGWRWSKAGNGLNASGPCSPYWAGAFMVPHLLVLSECLITRLNYLFIKHFRHTKGD